METHEGCSKKLKAGFCLNNLSSLSKSLRSQPSRFEQCRKKKKKPTRYISGIFSQARLAQREPKGGWTPPPQPPKRERERESPSKCHGAPQVFAPVMAGNSEKVPIASAGPEDLQQFMPPVRIDPFKAKCFSMGGNWLVSKTRHRGQAVKCFDVLLIFIFFNFFAGVLHRGRETCGDRARPKGRYRGAHRRSPVAPPGGRRSLLLLEQH